MYEQSDLDNQVSLFLEIPLKDCKDQDRSHEHISLRSLLYECFLGVGSTECPLEYLFKNIIEQIIRTT